MATAYVTLLDTLLYMLVLPAAALYISILLHLVGCSVTVELLGRLGPYVAALAASTSSHDN
jgi:hypothetical protein